MQQQEIELLQEYLLKHFSQPTVDQMMDRPLTGPNGLRKQLGEMDMEYFARAYFPDRFFRPMPPFHSEGYGVLQAIADHPGGNRYVEAAPRGYSKSTRDAFVFPINNIVYKRKHYIFIISDTGQQASELLIDIEAELEGNERILEDFGKLMGSPWNTNECITKSGIRVESAGSGQRIRGKKHRGFRPDLLILDELENDENTATAEQRGKLRNWFTKVVLKLGDTYTDFIYDGTILHYDSLLMWALKNPIWEAVIYRAVISFSERGDLWDEWQEILVDLTRKKRQEEALAFFNAHKDEMLKGTEILWEEKQTYYDLMMVRVTEGEASFNSELQNEPINPEDRLFSCKYYTELPSLDELQIFGAVDPSMGKTKTADYAPIITLGFHKETGYIYVLDAIIKRLHPDMIIETIFDRYEIYQHQRFAVETVAFQQFFKDELVKRGAKRGIYLNIKEIHPIKNKEMRIQSMQPMINNGFVKFHPSQRLLIEQLENFPKASHDDGPDCLEMALSLIKHSGRSKLIRPGQNHVTVEPIEAEENSMMKTMPQMALKLGNMLPTPSKPGKKLPTRSCPDCGKELTTHRNSTLFTMSQGKPEVQKKTYWQCPEHGWKEIS